MIAHFACYALLVLAELRSLKDKWKASRRIWRGPCFIKDSDPWDTEVFRGFAHASSRTWLEPLGAYNMSSTILDNASRLCWS